MVGDRQPTIGGFNRWPGGRWDRTRSRAGLGGREALLKASALRRGRRRYTPEMLMQNLEEVWRALGRRPGVTTLRRHGRYSADPYVLRWGSVRQACKRLAQHHAGKLTRAQLLKPSVARFGRARRKPIRPSDRHAVLTRDGGKCVICGRGPGHGDAVKLEVVEGRASVTAERGGGVLASAKGCAQRAGAVVACMPEHGCARAWPREAAWVRRDESCRGRGRGRGRWCP